MVDIGIKRMKRYLETAIECEKNVYIWSETMKHANKEMEKIYEDQIETNESLELIKCKSINSIQERNKLVEKAVWLLAAEQCVEEWQDEIHKSYKQALAARQKLYSLNIIDQRFRNFTCLTLFYDYIQTGRVTVVNGLGGLVDTLIKDKQFETFMKVSTDLRAIATDISIKQSFLVEQARETNRIQTQISNQLSTLNRNVTFLGAQQARTVAIANRIDSELRYGF